MLHNRRHCIGGLIAYGCALQCGRLWLLAAGLACAASYLEIAAGALALHTALVPACEVARIRFWHWQFSVLIHHRDPCCLIKIAALRRWRGRAQLDSENKHRAAAESH